MALLPLATFLIIFLGTGFYLHYIKEVEFAFYHTPVAAFMGLIVGIIVLKGSLNEKVDIIVRGIGNSNIIIMCLVFLLAGAFAATADAMGGVESTVNLEYLLFPVVYFCLVFCNIIFYCHCYGDFNGNHRCDGTYCHRDC